MIPYYYVKWDEVRKVWCLMVTPPHEVVATCPSKEIAELLATCMNDLVERMP